MVPPRSMRPVHAMGWFLCPVVGATCVLMAACAASKGSLVRPPPNDRTGVAAERPAAATSKAPAPERWSLEAISTDGTRALMRRQDGERGAPLRARVVDVDSGAVLRDEVFPALATLATATAERGPSAELDPALRAPALGDELVRGAEIAAPFPFGSWGRLAASPGRRIIAFNAGDFIYVADGRGHVVGRLTREPAYDPRFAPGGRHFFFRRTTGRVDGGFGRYEIFVAPEDPTKPPRRVAGTAGAREEMTAGEGKRVAVAIVSQEPKIKTCMIALAVEPAPVAKRLACLDGGEPLVEAVLSPRGRWAALTTQASRVASRTREQRGDERVEPVAPSWRLRVVALETGRVVLDEPAEVGVTSRAISDEGVLVLSGARGAVAVDVKGKRRSILAGGEESEEIGRGFFRSPTELVIARGSGVVVIDLAKR